MHALSSFICPCYCVIIIMSSGAYIRISLLVSTTRHCLCFDIYYPSQLWIFVMLSGQMWNHIRGPPLYHRNPQTGQIVSATCGLMVKISPVATPLSCVMPLPPPPPPPPPPPLPPPLPSVSPLRDISVVPASTSL